MLLRPHDDEVGILEEIQAEARAAHKRLPEYVILLYRQSRENAAREQARALEAETGPRSLTYADGFAVGSLLGELRVAFSWHVENDVPLGELRAWAKANPLLGGYLLQAMSEEPSGSRFLEWWRTMLLGPERVDHASVESA